ncbi:SsgA family sporulation/cell division regulator [Amycolatopsis sp. NPDC059657]|uniref:SsgA family sporulation/cell division regulator n=1 Tax=Amycolatopsis sp. NPDC059657 TaxID=3346899 RepID=UPI00366C7DE9
MNAMTMRIQASLPVGNAELVATYRPQEPFGVLLDFSNLYPGTEWMVSRDLLAAALRHGHAGHAAGAIHVTARGDLVVLALTGSTGTATVVFRRDDVAELVNRTHRLVRPGDESLVLDWSDITDFPGVSL